PASRGLGDVSKEQLLYSLIGTCKLNGVEPESYLRYVLDVIADWPINRVGELLPWRVALPTE
ncbi:transposase domain-containing protein, partial [Escherichia coli]|uniref:transposase domain-containing protein n=1 Tax=Escherichia coli TaxID=562 RepID=UPI000AE5961F